MTTNQKAAPKWGNFRFIHFGHFMEMHAPLFTIASPTCTGREIYTSYKEKATMRDWHCSTARRKHAPTSKQKEYEKATYTKVEEKKCNVHRGLTGAEVKIAPEYKRKNESRKFNFSFTVWRERMWKCYFFLRWRDGKGKLNRENLDISPPYLS